MCGGTFFPSAADVLGKGLSPRVRGNLCWSIQAMTPYRSIPACAGEPTPVVTPTTPVTVYPRVCGGTPISHKRSEEKRGLSPRVRGNPACQRPRRFR